MTSISGGASVNVKIDLGGVVDRAIKTTKKSIQDIENLGTVRVDSPGRRYLDERGKRADGVMDKLTRGEVIGAALDVFQAFSPGGRISDGAKALGLVRSDAEKYMLSGVCNALLLGPLNPATLADGEDFLKTQLPHLQQVGKDFAQLGARPHSSDVHVAPPHFVPSPRVQLRAGLKVEGYARARIHGKIDIDASLRRPQFQARLNMYAAVGMSANIVLGGFAAALPGLIAHFAGGSSSSSSAAQAAPASQTAQASQAAPATPATETAAGDRPKVSDESVSKFLSDPKLSFEDKLFLFMLAMAQRQEKKMQAMMAEYDKAKADPNSEVSKTRGERDKKAGEGAANTAPSGAASSASTGSPPAGMPAVGKGQDGQLRPLGGKNNSTLGGIVDVVKGLGSPAVRMIGQAAPMAAPALGSLLGGIIGTAIPIPIVGTALGAAIGGIVGDLLAKQVIPAACDQIANGLENGDYDQLLKFGTVVAANSAVPGAGMLLQAEDAGLGSLLMPFSYLNPAVQSKSAQGEPGAEAALSEDSSASAGSTPATATGSGKSGKAAKAAAANAASNASAADEDSGLQGDPNKRSEQEWSMHLQKAQQDLSQMYQMVSNLMKAFHDTQMTAVRNLR